MEKLYGRNGTVQNTSNGTMGGIEKGVPGRLKSLATMCGS